MKQNHIMFKLCDVKKALIGLHMETKLSFSLMSEICL